MHGVHRPGLCVMVDDVFRFWHIHISIAIHGHGAFQLSSW